MNKLSENRKVDGTKIIRTIRVTVSIEDEYVSEQSTSSKTYISDR